jgi:hypothetical protein
MKLDPHWLRAGSARPIAASKLSKSMLANGSLYVFSSQLFVKVLSEKGILIVDLVSRLIVSVIG